jgi:hypothetical protein
VSTQKGRVTIKRLAALLGGLVAGGVATVLIVRAIPIGLQVVQFIASAADAEARERSAELLWRREFGDPAWFLGSFPPLTESAAARRVAELSSRLSETATPDIRTAVERYLTAEANKTGKPVDPPVAEVASHLATIQADLDSLERSLLDEGSVVWPWNPAEYFGDNAIDHRAIRRAHDFLIARALVRGLAGNLPLAERSLKSGWSLIASIRGRPTILSQLVVLALMDRQLVALRGMPIDPATWRLRLAEHDVRTAFWAAVQMDQVAVLGAFPRDPDSLWRSARADFLDITRAALTAVRDAPVDDRLPDLPDAAEPVHGPSVGSLFASFSTPGLMRSFVSANKLVLETELVDRILAARLARRALGRWPAHPPEGFEISRLRDAGWVYTVSGARLTIALRRSSDATPVVRFESDR